jgi:hypothetical protein
VVTKPEDATSLIPEPFIGRDPEYFHLPHMLTKYFSKTHYIKSFHLYIVFSIDRFSTGFPIKTLYAFVVYPILNIKFGGM